MRGVSLCPVCQIKISGNYCRTCGAILIPLPDNPKCECGEELSEYDNYCRWCGRKVELDDNLLLPDSETRPEIGYNAFH